jgi:hypothetical protein
VRGLGSSLSRAEKSMVNREKQRASHKRWVAKNKDKYRLITNRCKRDWEKKNPDKVRQYRNKYDAKYPNSRRSYVYTQEDVYTPLLSAQDGKCAICGCLPNGKRLSIDHDHNDGKIRGLLCSNCNLALGLFKDSVTNLSKAISYLEAIHYK